jgi:hypothetical protein
LATVETEIRRQFSGRGLGKLLVLLFLAAMAASCAVLQSRPPSNLYYIIPSVTYFRASPGYASTNVATVYRGQQVKILSGMADNWCRVEAVPGGQVGWIKRPLLSPVPIPTVTYTVTAAEVPLRDEPKKEGVSRYTLHKGDKIRKLSENQEGWWWVLVEKDESLGWLVGNVLSEKGEAAAPAGPATAPSGAAVSPPAAPPYLYVAVGSLDLHLLPLLNSQVVKSLKFNDKVEKIGQSEAEWLKVRYPETGAQGWAQAPTLTASPSKAPKVYPPPKKKRIPKKLPTAKPTAPETPQTEEIAPEAM